MPLIIPPQEQNIKALVDCYYSDYDNLTKEEKKKISRFDYVQQQIYKLPLVAHCPEMFSDVPIIRDYLKLP